MATGTDLNDPVAEGVYFALFKVLSVADLAGDEKAIEWVRSAVENEALLRSLADGTRKAGAARIESAPTPIRPD
jgi:hypothetical protein